MARLSIRDLSATEPDELDGLLPNYAMRCVPLTGSRFHVGMTTIAAPGLALQIGQCSPLVGHGAPAAGIAAIQVPLGGHRTLRLNGEMLEAPAIGLYGPGSEVHRANPRGSTWLVIALPAASVEARLDPPAGTALQRRGAHAVLSISPAVQEAMARLGQGALAAARDGETLQDPEAARAFEADLAEAARGLLRATAPPASTERASAANTRIVAQAEAFVSSVLTRAVYNDEICNALGVSSTRLAVAFQAVLGISPQRYLKLRRLSGLRHALRRPADPQELVKSVCLRHGFWHLGQLAADYQALFNETPSQTMAAARRTLFGTQTSGPDTSPEIDIGILPRPFSEPDRPG